MPSPYLFTSERLGFRNWKKEDIEPMANISSDEKVMEFFPYVARFDQTEAFIFRMIEMCNKKGYCYFAVEILDTKEFIGFIGLSDQDYDAPFTPCIDIGWRLTTEHWGNGYATEGAKKCIEYAFQELKLKEIFSITPQINQKSEAVMRKIGMNKHLNFKHDRLEEYQHLADCVCYKIESNNYLYNY